MKPDDPNDRHSEASNFGIETDPPFKLWFGPGSLSIITHRAPLLEHRQVLVAFHHSSSFKLQGWKIRPRLPQGAPLGRSRDHNPPVSVQWHIMHHASCFNATTQAWSVSWLCVINRTRESKTSSSVYRIHTIDNGYGGSAKVRVLRLSILQFMNLYVFPLIQ